MSKAIRAAFTNTVHTVALQTVDLNTNKRPKSVCNIGYKMINNSVSRTFCYSPFLCKGKKEYCTAVWFYILTKYLITKNLLHWVLYSLKGPQNWCDTTVKHHAVRKRNADPYPWAGVSKMVIETWLKLYVKQTNIGLFF